MIFNHNAESTFQQSGSPGPLSIITGNVKNERATSINWSSIMYGGNTNVVVQRLFSAARPQSMNVTHRKYIRQLTNEFKERAEFSPKRTIPDEFLLKFPK